MDAQSLQELSEAPDLLQDQRWRLNNLYYVKDKAGDCVLFKMNGAQRKLFKELHYLNIILKARQLGFTTFIQLYMLDMAVFHANTNCGVIAHTPPGRRDDLPGEDQVRL